MFEIKPLKICVKCGKEIGIGLMNEVEHWIGCPKNTVVSKYLCSKSPLIEEIKKITPF